MFSPPQQKVPIMQAQEAVLDIHGYATNEKPQNGIAGLKHWRSDLLAGIMVSDFPHISI